ncbi:RNA 2',3'-cyclic phosphodiesterase [Streptomonospora litoralis]|uniref:RNA 2',3'-cyclic phosphodiesterase n=1 Tax=Streptomonospora litoralis TaxID=2498135 RepID=A0A4P6Q0F2_9ACTN|nr:RNA 2',3'-cyclic phosphodiesterase [Streptomonospora litoralis]QBI52279.1 2',5' RNA ligase family [Streptomonospora litoralis]
MRLFVAVYPPEEVLDEVARTADALGAADRLGVAGGVLDTGGGAAEPRRQVRLGRGLRWSEPGEWHLTLVFLGDVPDDTLPRLRRRMSAEAARHERPAIAFRGGGTFPGDTAQAGVLWAGIEGDIDTVTGLAAGLRKAARKSGVRLQRRAFVPHLTLARSRPPTDMTALRYGLGTLATPFWTVGEIHLVHSEPGEQPRYRTLETWPLG